MTRNKLPNQLVFIVTTVLLAVLFIVWFSLFSVRYGMDTEAAEESERLMAGRIDAFQKQVSLIARDYHNWTDLYINAKRLEYDRLGSNYGITADRGEVFQYSELFDGPFPEPVSWSMGRGRIPQDGILSPTTRDALRQRIPELDHGERQTEDYFELISGRLVMFSASYLLPEDEDLLLEIVPEFEAIGVVGKVLSVRRLSDIEREFSISDLAVSAAPPLETSASISLVDVTGKPLAWLYWSPPTPGTHLFWKMFPLISGVSVAFVLVSFFAAQLLRGKAKILIEKEAISFKNARTDALTSLPNRLALREYLTRLSHQTDMDCAVLAIDLVRFKQINDTVGHLGGDIFLVEFSRRLRKLTDETTFVSRYGGDEFFVVIGSAGDLESAIDIKCKQLVDLTTEPIQCKGVTFDVLASKGIATSENQLFDQDSLLGRADRAMYSAKARASQEIVRYDSQMELLDLDYKRIEEKLRRAVAESNGFAIHYQPIASTLKGQHIIRYEALARWSCPELGRVPPEKFIHVAEMSGLIVDLGWILLDLVCQDMKSLNCSIVCINVSPTQVMTPGFAEEFADRVIANGIRPTEIQIELTEQIAVLDDIAIAKELSILRQGGFSLALDDFGTGYSSIGYLTRMQFDVLKIDRSFVHSMHGGKQGARMLRSMVGLARAMDLEIVAEGVETAKDAHALHSIGVDYLQGYHIGRPMPLEAHLIGLSSPT